jgi:demethylmenaquinone methyltransferase / 2-methoxy-6-polyprenyl-1,4-benzoquinol methylase
MPDPTAINAMFARVARRYDLANHLLSGGMDLWWRRRLVMAVRRHSPRDVLDLATGSGDVAFALARVLPPGIPINGMDFCQPMLDEAVRKKTAAGPNSPYSGVTFHQGDGLALPLADESFDVVTISFGLRNMADRAKALSEMRRVLRPGGRLFVLEFSQPAAWFRPLYFFYLGNFAPRLAGLVTDVSTAYDYLCSSIEQFPDRAALTTEFERAGFARVTDQGLTLGIVALHKATK